MKTERMKYELIFVLATLFLLCLVTSAQAADMGEIRSGETRTGNITYEAQNDSFTFYGTAGQTVVIEMVAFESDNGATITDLKQSFTWDVVSVATGYELYFGEDAVVPLEKIGENLTSQEMSFPVMEWDKVYYRHVEAHPPPTWERSLQTQSAWSSCR